MDFLGPTITLSEKIVTMLGKFLEGFPNVRKISSVSLDLKYDIAVTTG